jgi:hypothetical protein
VTIDGCRFEQNTATRGAGAVWIEDSNVVKISNTRFIGNAITLEAADYECTPVGENFCGQEFNFPGGAALWMNTPNLLKVSPEFEDVDGDGAVDIIFPQCQELTPVGPFPLNCSNKDVIGGNLHMSDCVFEGNTACTGTHSFYTEGTDVFMEDSIIRGNFGGAGAYINSFFPGTAGEQSACLRNLLVVGNRAISKGSGVVTFINNLKVENATFANNNIGLGNHPALSVKHQNYDWCSRAVVTNSIFAGNTGSDLDPFFDNVAAFGSCDLRITYSDLPPAWAACEGGREPDTCPDGSSTDKCVYGDPMFVGDYYLDVLSPCVGKGDCCLSASCEPEPGGPVVPDCPAEQSADPGTTDCDQDVDVERLDLGYHHPQGPPPVDCLLYCETDCCETIKDCADGDDDGIRDDGCMWWACESGICAGTDIVFADMGGPNDCCLPDGTADANDKFHALRCFTDTDISGSPGNPCEASPPVAFNVDAGGPFGDCAPDGVCDGNDAFHALNAFGMVSACSCPSGSSPATTIAANVQVRSTSTPGIIQPGQQVRVRVFFVTALPDVRGYQLHLRPSGGTSGELELVDMAIENRSDAVFYNHGAWEAFNADSEQLVAGLDGNGIATAANAYLATYLYQASPDASGWFTFNLLYDNPNGTSRTFLFPTAPNSKIKITSYTAARVKVQF